MSDKKVTPQPGPAPDCEEMRKEKKRKALTLEEMKEMHIGASHEQPPEGAETSGMEPLPEVEFIENVGKAVSYMADTASSAVEAVENFLNDCACEVSSKDGGWFDWVLDIPRGYCGEEEGSPFKYVGAVGKGIQKFATNMVKGTLNMAGHPVETAKGIKYAVIHPQELGAALKEHYWESRKTTTQKVAGVTEAICDVAFLAYGAKKGFDKVSEWAKARKAAKMAVTGETAGEVAKVGEAGAEVAEDAGKVVEEGAVGGKGKVKIESRKTSDFIPPKVYIDERGKVTNGIYVVDEVKMKPHLAGGPAKKSRFDFDVDTNKAVLDAAAYADKYNLWYASSGNPNGFADKAKVFVTNGPVGRNSAGEYVDYINIYRTKTGYIHGCPGNP